MTHEHGSEYQVRIVHEDETEELTGWINCQEELAQAITGLRRSPAKAYWLRVRNIRCLSCLDRELTIVEFPLTLTATTRYPTLPDRISLATSPLIARQPLRAHT